MKHNMIDQMNEIAIKAKKLEIMSQPTREAIEGEFYEWARTHLIGGDKLTDEQIIELAEEMYDKS